jgi:hypothetical protein
MAKPDIYKILKPGVTVGDLKNIRVIDYSTPEKQRQLKLLDERCKRILASKNVDWDAMSRMRFDI